MKVVQWLRDQGHDCTHLREEGLQRMPNGDIFSKAVAENRIILTFDLDFAEIVATAGSRLPSVIIFRLRNARADHVIERLAVMFERAAEQLAQGAIVVLEESQVRIRELPVGGTG